MKNLRRTALSIFLGFLFFSAPSQNNASALELLVSGACAFPAAKKFWSSPSPALRSTPGSVQLHVVNDAGRNAPWRVEVRLQGVSLPGATTLSVRRTGSGQGFGWIDGGLAFVSVGERPVTLCKGTGDRMQIPLQIQFSGVTPSTPSGELRSGILFTVVTQP